VGRLEARKEDESIGPLADLANQLILLQPRRTVGAARAPVPHPRRSAGQSPQLKVLVVLFSDAVMALGPLSLACWTNGNERR
jgi:hypothetical protein